MADPKEIWVKPTGRGQKPDRTWADENSAPFQCDEAFFSKRWMKKLTAAELKSLQSVADVAGDDAEPSGDLEALISERDELLGKVEGLEADLKAMTDERDAMDKKGKELAAEVNKVMEERDKLKKPPSALSSDKKA